MIITIVLFSSSLAEDHQQSSASTPPLLTIYSIIIITSFNLFIYFNLSSLLLLLTLMLLCLVCFSFISLLFLLANLQLLLSALLSFGLTSSSPSVGAVVAISVPQQHHQLFLLWFGKLTSSDVVLLLLRSCCCLRCSTVFAEFVDGAFSSISSTWSNHFGSPGVFSPAVSFSIATLSFSYFLLLAICCPCAALELLLLSRSLLWLLPSCHLLQQCHELFPLLRRIIALR